MVDQLLSAMEQYDYPAGELDVILAVEADCHDTAAITERQHRIPVMVIPVPPGEPRTKPKALSGWHARYFTAEYAGHFDFFLPRRLVCLYRSADRPIISAPKRPMLAAGTHIMSPRTPILASGWPGWRSPAASIPQPMKKAPANIRRWLTLTLVQRLDADMARAYAASVATVSGPRLLRLCNVSSNCRRQCVGGAGASGVSRWGVLGTGCADF